ncbi:MAG: hypothetical protein AAF412_13360 [Pseudomonadota bacterium]
MKNLIACLVFCLGMVAPGYTQTASEVPLENPEVLEPPSRPGGEKARPQEEPEAPNAEADPASPMNVARLAEIIQALDPNAAITGSAMRLTIAEVPITVITDPRANRMRAFSAFKTLDGVNGQQLYRMMQANFDAALDARYAVAKGHVISVFIHPLAELGKDQLIEGLGQVVNLVKTFGTAYTSGAMTFGGGDSQNLHRELIDNLLKKGERI